MTLKTTRIEKIKKSDDAFFHHFLRKKEKMNK